MLGYYNRTGWKLPIASRIANKYRRFRHHNKPYHPAAFFAIDTMLGGLRLLPVAVAFVIIYSQVS